MGRSRQLPRWMTEPTGEGGKDPGRRGCVGRERRQLSNRQKYYIDRARPERQAWRQKKQPIKQQEDDRERQRGADHDEEEPPRVSFAVGESVTPLGTWRVHCNSRKQNKRTQQHNADYDQ